MQKSMTSGNSLKLLLTFMVPLIIGNIFQQMYSISDIIIVGRTIGVNALASVGAAAPIFMLLVMITMGMSNGLTVITGQFFGAGDMEKMRRSVAMSMMLKSIDKDYKNNSEIKWNFTKFVINREGEVVARFEPTADMNKVEECVASLI